MAAFPRTTYGARDTAAEIFTNKRANSIFRFFSGFRHGADGSGAGSEKFQRNMKIQSVLPIMSNFQQNRLKNKKVKGVVCAWSALARPHWSAPARRRPSSRCFSALRRRIPKQIGHKIQLTYATMCVKFGRILFRYERTTLNNSQLTKSAATRPAAREFEFDCVRLAVLS